MRDVVADAGRGDDEERDRDEEDPASRRHGIAGAIRAS